MAEGEGPSTTGSGQNSLSSQGSAKFFLPDEEEQELNNKIRDLETDLSSIKQDVKEAKRSYLQKLEDERIRQKEELQKYSSIYTENEDGVTWRNGTEKDIQLEKLRHAGFATLAAATGDLSTLQRMNREGKDLSHGDYDGRTPLQLAVAEGQIDCVQFLLECNVDCSVKDRWGNTVLQEARHSKQANKDKILGLLKEHLTKQVVDPIAAASQGDLDRLRKMYEEGMNMNCHNTDKRTPLHLACVEGHSDVVKFLLEECNVTWDSCDRWNRTPFQDALNYRHGKILTVFRKYFKANNIHPTMSESD